MAEVFKAVGLLASFAIIYVPGALWFAYVQATLWGWFIVPIFSLPPLTLLQCWAIMLTVEAFRPNTRWQKQDPAEALNSIGLMILVPAFLLGIGWSIKNWAM